MRTATRLIGATTAVAVGVALLGAGGGSRAAWYDTAQVPGATVTSGVLRVDAGPTAVRADAATGTAVIDAPATLALAGDALTADLSVQVSVTQADGSPPAGLRVDVVSDLPLRPTGTHRWAVGAAENAATVTARVTMPIEAVLAVIGTPRVTWTLTQTGTGTAWSSQVVQEASLEALRPTSPAFPRFDATPGERGSGTLTFVWHGSDIHRWRFDAMGYWLGVDTLQRIRVTPTPTGKPGEYTVQLSGLSTGPGWTYRLRATQWLDRVETARFDPVTLTPIGR